MRTRGRAAPRGRVRDFSGRFAWDILGRFAWDILGASFARQQ